MCVSTVFWLRNRRLPIEAFECPSAIRPSTSCWRGVRPINIDAPVRYFGAGEGGVSNFRYLRDNLLLSGMHARLFAGFLLRLPLLLWRRLLG